MTLTIKRKRMNLHEKIKDARRIHKDELDTLNKLIEQYDDLYKLINAQEIVVEQKKDELDSLISQEEYEW